MFRALALRQSNGEIFFVGVSDVCFVSVYYAGKKPTGVSESENKRIP